jgi:hypothetical protein
MATIRARKRTDGSTSYTAQIRLFRDGAQVYQESQTFARKQAAQVWVRKRERYCFHSRWGYCESSRHKIESDNAITASLGLTAYGFGFNRSMRYN